MDATKNCATKVLWLSYKYIKLLISVRIQMKVAQMLLCKFVIMQDSNINTAIDNRRVYHLVAYFFFLNVSYIFGDPTVQAGYLTCTI